MRRVSSALRNFKVFKHLKMKGKLLLILLFQIVYSTIEVVSPNSLVSKFLKKYHTNPIPMELANFGNPPYGSNIVGRVYYLGGESNDGAAFACEELPEIKNYSKNMILLIDRGECPFVDKVRHAEDIGAVAVIFSDTNDDLVYDELMHDNSHGGNLSIPSILITQSDAQLLKNAINDSKADTFVSVKISFDMIPKSHKVDVQLWMNSDIEHIRQFLYEFGRFAKGFKKEEFEFSPRFVTQQN